MLDLIVRGGLIVDGTGSAPYLGDVAVVAGKIVEIGIELTGEAVQVVEARGRVVTPGFVDLHTHYDGQATWDEVLDPSSSHGVTTVVMGNCGVGFAPVRRGHEATLIELMEGVEDIPGAVLSEGMDWRWESFPEYLDVLESQRWSVDVAAQIPHGAVRTYVMGQRAVGASEAEPDEIALMARLVREAIEAGAFGFTTSRTRGHRSLDGNPVPGTFAGDAELTALGAAVAGGGGRIFEVARAGLHPHDDPSTAESELDWIGRLAAETGLATTVLVMQTSNAPDEWRRDLDRARLWRDRGAQVVPLVAGRPFGVLWGWDVRHPFLARASYRGLAHLPLTDRVAELRRPKTRAAILAEENTFADGDQERLIKMITRSLPTTLPLHGVPDYELPFESSLGQLAAARGVSIDTVAYDEMLPDGAMLNFPLYNYVAFNGDVLHEQLDDSAAVLGLNDGGAHSLFICDASIPTYVLTHWVRDRQRGPRLNLADAIRRLSAQPADLYGMADRGRIAVGLRADLNVIDTDGLRLALPRAVSDLPAGGTRLLQDATGYDATIVAGQITRRHGVDTGARPGRLLRRS